MATAECTYCGDTVERPKHRLERSDNIFFFCNHECHQNWRREGNIPNKKEKVKIECENCGDIFEVQPYRENTARFCSGSCKGQNSAKKYLGDHAKPKEKVTLECKNCGNEFKVYPYRKDEAKFCSRSCAAKYNAKESLGEHIEPVEKVTLECKNCGDEFKVYPYNTDRATYCSKECLYSGRNNSGPNNPNWRGGHVKSYRGKDWATQRSKAIERDNNKCCLCGISNDLHNMIFGFGLDVHHIVPYHISENNNLNSLLTLCRTCHGKVEEKTYS